MNKIEERWLNQQFPQFSLRDEDGNTYSNSSLIGKWSVIFFYPRDESPGCAVQAIKFSKSYDAFNALNCQILGISSDGQHSHKNFRCNSELNYPLLTDEKASLRRQLGLGKSLGLIPKRVSFVVDEMGVIRYIFDSQLAVKKHAIKTLDFLKTKSDFSL